MPRSRTTKYQLQCPHCDELITIDIEIPPEEAPNPAPPPPDQPLRAPRARRGLRELDYPPGYFPRA